MKKLRKITITIFALPFALSATAAFAGGLAEPVIPVAPPPPPPPAPISNWTGPYAGVQVGIIDVTIEDAITSLTTAATEDLDFDGAIYGLHAGYLYDFGALVLGGEIDYDASDADGALTADTDVEVDYVARLKLRVGYDAGVVMPYLTAGVAQLQVSADGDESDDNGTFFGGGLDYRVGPNIRVGVEALQHRFEDFDDADDVEATTFAIRASYTF